MFRLLIPVVLAMLFVLATPASAYGCEFKLGFKALRDLVGHEIVGECLEDEHYNEIGDSVQQTTGGLLVWRKADNWTAFTDGYRTWLNGSDGLMKRLNSQRFEWELGYQSDNVIRCHEYEHYVNSCDAEVFWDNYVAWLRKTAMGESVYHWFAATNWSIWIYKNSRACGRGIGAGEWFTVSPACDYSRITGYLVERLNVFEQHGSPFPQDEDLDELLLRDRMKREGYTRLEALVDDELLPAMQLLKTSGALGAKWYDFILDNALYVRIQDARDRCGQAVGFIHVSRDCLGNHERTAAIIVHEAAHILWHYERGYSAKSVEECFQNELNSATHEAAWYSEYSGQPARIVTLEWVKSVPLWQQSCSHYAESRILASSLDLR